MDDETDFVDQEPDFEANGARNDKRDLVTVLLWSIRQGWAEPADLLKAAKEYDIEWPEEDEDSVFQEETEQERAMGVLCPEAHTVYEWAKAYGEDAESLLDKFSRVSIDGSEGTQAEHEWWQDAYYEDFQSPLDELSEMRASDGIESDEYDAWGDGYEPDVESLLDKLSGFSVADGAETEECDW